MCRLFSSSLTCSAISVQLRDSPHAQAYALLELFCYGTLEDYRGKLIWTLAEHMASVYLPHRMLEAMKAVYFHITATARYRWPAPGSPEKFPPLSEAQLLKLRQLTVVSMAANAKVREPACRSDCSP